MEKCEFNCKFRQYVKDVISITQDDRAFVTSIYKSFQELFGRDNTLQIGSYPRFTAIRPLHDLDILFIIGNWCEKNHSPKELLKTLLDKIENEYNNPTKYETGILPQTHSVAVTFKDNNGDGDCVFSVDIIPAYIYSTNEFNEHTYQVPEIIRQKQGRKRKDFYKTLLSEHKEMNWIRTDPRGYTEVAKQLKQSNDDFIKTVKFIKAWINLCKEKNEDFKLKSFHIEQIIAEYFQNESGLEIFDGIFKFFIEIPQAIKSPKISDRANMTKYIDEYLNDLTEGQKNQIIQARDCFLKKLENFSECNSVENLIAACFYQRVSDSEKFLFDSKIPVLTNPAYRFQIHGEVQQKDGFRRCILDGTGHTKSDREIKFLIANNKLKVDLFKFKVKNDDTSQQPRGEITDDGTLNPVEHTKYIGQHYVECYAILNNICVAKAKQNVVVK